jgi:hypothetical protein
LPKLFLQSLERELMGLPLFAHRVDLGVNLLGTAGIIAFEKKVKCRPLSSTVTDTDIPNIRYL